MRTGHIAKQYRQFVCKVTLRRVRIPIVAMEKKTRVLNILSLSVALVIQLEQRMRYIIL